MQVDKNAERKKGKGGKTVSSYFKGQLDDLMGVLYKTEPSFIRCVVPNTHKIPEGIEPVWTRAVAALRRQCEKKAEKARRRLKGAKAPPFFQEPF